MNQFQGLSTTEAQEQLKKVGFNTLPEEKSSAIRRFLEKFWSPIPWMLEIVIVLEYVLGKYSEATIIILLLLFNVFLSFFQERKATKALQLLKSQLNVAARVLRDNVWRMLPANELVPGDIICIRMGDVVPADVHILSGHLMMDQSSLTGEAMPIEASVSAKAYAGSIVKRGEAFVKVTSTGKNTYFGKTAELVAIAKAPSHLQKIIYQIIKYLIVFNSLLVFFVFIYSVDHHLSMIEIIPFLLLILVATIPVALPATYTLACALASLKLSKLGIIVTKLSGIEEAAAMSILCIDKTGTITKNVLEVSHLHVYKNYTSSDLISLASLACEVATQDPIDLAILQEVKKLSSSYLNAEKILSIPFDPSKRYTETVILYNQKHVRILKGDPLKLLNMTNQNSNVAKDIEELAKDGSRVVAIVQGEEHNALEMVGLVAFQDPPREDSKVAIQEIQDLNIKLIMITGDSYPTALSLAQKVGLGTNILTREEIYQKPLEEILNCDIIAGVFPEDKYYIINLLQKSGKICGMTGDGVNDAPALKKAEVGIALSNACDVAKTSANIILTKPGFKDLIQAIKTSREVYERMLTYTLNKIIKTLEIAVLLTLGLMFAKHLIITPFLIVLLLFANDFVAMSISTDHVCYSKQISKWNIKKVMGTSAFFASLILLFSFALFYLALFVLHFNLLQIQTWVFLILVFTGQATIYLVRERKVFWHSMPSIWMILSSIVDISIVSFLAITGTFMASIKALDVFALIAIMTCYFFVLDIMKVWICKKINLE